MPYRVFIALVKFISADSGNSWAVVALTPITNPINQDGSDLTVEK
jgi:hypothetical protein